METKELIENYLKELTEKHKADDDVNYPNLQKSFNGQYHSFSVEYGSRYGKVIVNAGGSKSVHCFIDLASGDILKAASFKMPQKNGKRGSIHNEKKPIFGSDFYVNKSIV